MRLSRAITRSEGPAIVIGAAGTGKSLLLEVLAAQFQDKMSVVTLVGAQLCTRKALLQMILFEIGLPYRGMDEGELRLSLVEYLRPREGGGNRMLLLVDEADSLPTRLLQELRVLTNLSNQGQPQVNLVLAGSAILEERFAEPQLEVFSQRVSVRCYLVPLGREETFAYVRSQIAASGCDVDQLISPDGLEAIFSATDGLPRLINQLGNQLVWMAAETGCHPLDGALVQQAWSELQQLPAPWNGPTVDAMSDSGQASETVEFGELEDSPVDMTICEDGICEDGVEDEMPASIPFNMQYQRDNNAPGSPIDLSEPLGSVDVTEKLLRELSEMGQFTPTEQSTPSVPEVATPPTAHNPFEEAFASEEVLLDQYASFEGQLLAKAQPVFNRQDIQFSQELGRCEMGHCEVGSCDSSHGEADASAVAVLATPTVKSEEPQLATFSPDGMKAEETIEEVKPQRAHVESRGNVLVVEPNKSNSATVIQGKQFRQLFSQLEYGGC